MIFGNKRNVTHYEGRWRVYRNHSAEMIAEFNSQKEIQKHLVRETVCEAKRQSIHILMNFPSGWNINNEMYCNLQTEPAYDEWQQALNNIKDREEYFQKIEDKYQDLVSLL